MYVCMYVCMYVPVEVLQLQISVEVLVCRDFMEPGVDHPTQNPAKDYGIVGTFTGTCKRSELAQGIFLPRQGGTTLVVTDSG